MGSCRCGATWGGIKLEHCTVCHQTFTSSWSGDKHRTGRHDSFSGPNRRRCRTPEEMEDLGMRRNSRGHWSLGGTNPLDGNDLETARRTSVDTETGEPSTGPLISDVA